MCIRDRFTIEHEQNSSISFLDTKVIRQTDGTTVSYTHLDVYKRQPPVHVHTLRYKYTMRMVNLGKLVIKYIKYQLYQPKIFNFFSVLIFGKNVTSYELNFEH